MIRLTCGTKAGLLAHVTAGEEFCGTCLAHDAWLALSVELIPTRPTPYRPATVIPHLRVVKRAS